MTSIRTPDGCRRWVSGAGGGEPLILGHGGPGLWDMFADLAALLAPRLRVIRWDQRGCGRSEWFEAPDDVRAAILSHLSSRTGPVPHP